MFSQVTVCPWRRCLPLVPRGCLPLVAGGFSHTPLGRHPLGRHPHGQTPPGRNPQGRHLLLPSACWDTHPACPVHARIRSTSGRYASHWNAFLYSYTSIIATFVFPFIYSFLLYLQHRSIMLVNMKYQCSTFQDCGLQWCRSFPMAQLM